VVVITPGEDGWFVAEVPSLPGCISQGRTRAEARRNIRAAIALMREARDASRVGAKSPDVGGFAHDAGCVGEQKRSQSCW